MMAALLILVCAAFAGVVPAGPGAGDVFAARRVAVLIGVQDYADPALQGLRFSAKDARDVGSVLSDADRGGFDRVTVLTGSTATSRAGLLSALRTATADLQRDDTFLLYLSGHGTLTLDPIEGSRLWFLPSDARLDEPDRTGLSVSELEEFVSELPARRRVLILDTCHNGRAGSKSLVSGATANTLRGLRGEPPAPRADREISESEARLFAAQYYQPAMEDPELGNGVYTHFLLEGLTAANRDADLDRDGLVDVIEAHSYARDHTIAYTGGLQVPRAEYRIVGRQEIFLSGRSSERTAAEQALLSACDMVLNRARLLVNGIPRGEFPGLYAIEPGTQNIEVQTSDGRVLLKERVAFTAGSRVAFEDLMRARRGSVGVALGPSVVQGAAAFHPLTASLQVTWARPFNLGGPWRPDLHAAFDVATGEVPDAPVRPVATGAVTAGGTLGLSSGPFWAGPSLDVRVPFRFIDAATEQQATVTGAGGLSAGLELPIGRALFLTVRSDAWASAQPYDGGWSPVWGGALRVGFAAQP